MPTLADLQLLLESKTPHMSFVTQILSSTTAKNLHCGIHLLSLPIT